MRLVLPLLATLVILMPMMTLGAPLEDLHASFTTRRDFAEIDRDQQLKKLDTNYLAALDREMKKAQATGRLETVIPFRNESLSVKNGTDPLPALPPDATPKLKGMRAKYQEARDKILVSHAKTLVDLVEKMAKELKSNEIALTKAGDLDQALGAKRMRESLAKDASVLDARNLLAADNTKRNPEDWRSLFAEEMKVLKKYSREPCILSKVTPENRPLTPFVGVLKGLREKPERILMSHAPAILEFHLSNPVTRIRGKLFLANAAGSVRFKIHADGKVVFEQEINKEAKSFPFEVIFNPTKIIQLETDPIEGINCDWSAWLGVDVQ